MEQEKMAPLKMLKGISKQQWLVIGILGILMVVIALPATEKASNATTTPSDGLLSEVETENEQAISLEGQLATLLSQVEGVGQVEVMVYSQEQNFASLSDSQNPGNIQGVLVVAEGADNPDTVCKIQDAVKALFQVEAHKIKVMKMK